MRFAVRNATASVCVRFVCSSVEEPELIFRKEALLGEAMAPSGEATALLLGTSPPPINSPTRRAVRLSMASVCRRLALSREDGREPLSFPELRGDVLPVGAIASLSGTERIDNDQA